jgi:hypothetical protein
MLLPRHRSLGSVRPRKKHTPYLYPMLLALYRASSKSTVHQRSYDTLEFRAKMAYLGGECDTICVEKLRKRRIWSDGGEYVVHFCF